jgi:hypothetical protein
MAKAALSKLNASDYIPRAVRVADISLIAALEAASLNAALKDRGKYKITTQQEADAQLDSLRRKWIGNLNDALVHNKARLAAGDQKLEVFRAYSPLGDDSKLHGIIWYGPCRSRPAFSGNWGEIYSLYMAPDSWDNAEDLVDLAAADFRRHGYEAILMHRRSSDPNAAGFYSEVFNHAGKFWTYPATDAGLVTEYRIDL